MATSRSHVGLDGGEKLESLNPVLGERDVMTLAGEEVARGHAHLLVIVDDEDLARAHVSLLSRFCRREHPPKRAKSILSPPPATVNKSARRPRAGKAE